MPTDLDLSCLPFSIWICINNPDQVNWLAEKTKWARHLNLFSMTRVKEWWHTFWMLSAICIRPCGCLLLNFLFFMFCTVHCLVDIIALDKMLSSTKKYLYFFLFPDENICLSQALLMSTHNICFHREIRKLLTLKMTRKPASKMSPVYVFCWIFLLTFQTYFCIQANSVDPNQTAPRGAVWSGSTLFAKITFKTSAGVCKTLCPQL